MLNKVLLAISIVFCCGCSESNNLLLGRVQATVGGHEVVVTDCYRTSVPAPSTDGSASHWTPCKDADIHFNDGEVTVNGKSYGKIGPRERLLVDHGAVSIEKSGEKSK